MTRTIDTPILIVGAGPIGMALAVDLGWRGAQAMLIEQGDGSIEQPKIGVMSVRTMELFRRWGIADRVRNGGFPENYRLSIQFCTSLAGHLLSREDYPTLAEMPTPPWTPERPKQRCPQMWLNPILQRAAEEQPTISLRFRTKLEGFEQSPSHVLASLRDLASGETLQIRAKYLVGCDGVGSAVRDALGIQMLGNPKLSYSVSILVRMSGLMQHIDKGEAERYIFVGPEGTWGNWTVIDGKDLWRLTILGTPEKLDLDTLDPVAWVKRALGRDDVPFEVLSVLPWRRSELIAERFRSGRVFLAGDSAHTMSPTGGMGMNTGMGDAADLGWKLGAALRGWGGPRLLDSYEMERKPIAARNAAFSTHNWNSWKAPKDCSAILEETEAGARLRREVGEGLRASTNLDWESWGLQMGYRYDQSPVCIKDGREPAPDDFATYIPSAQPGARAPHAWLPDGRSLLDLFGRGFVLLRFPEAEAQSVAALQAAAERHEVPLSVVPVADPGTARLYQDPLVLVRPDGHVAWRGSRAENAQQIVNTVRGAS